MVLGQWMKSVVESVYSWALKSLQTPVAKGGKVQFTVDHLRELFIVRFRFVNRGPPTVRMHCFTLKDESVQSLSIVRLPCCNNQQSSFFSLEKVSD